MKAVLRVALVAVLVTAVGHGQTAPTLKHHQLGETWAQFLENAPNMTIRANKCAVTTRPDPNKKVKKIIYNPCQDYWAAQDSPSRLSMDVECHSFGIGGADKNTVCSDFDGRIVFENGKLVEIEVAVIGTWQEIYPDLEAKFGKADSVTSAQWENVFGATWDNPLGVWSTPSYQAAAKQFGGFGDNNKAILVALETASRYKNNVRAVQSSHVNALD